jgi:GT2 family glycosyltransferase
MQSTQTIPLSIIIAIIKPRPDIYNCLISLYNQAQAVDAEVIIADGSTQGQPDDLARSYPKVTWLNKPGASVFWLSRNSRGNGSKLTLSSC